MSVDDTYERYSKIVKKVIKEEIKKISNKGENVYLSITNRLLDLIPDHIYSAVVRDDEISEQISKHAEKDVFVGGLNLTILFSVNPIEYVRFYRKSLYEKPEIISTLDDISEELTFNSTERDMIFWFEKKSLREFLERIDYTLTKKNRSIILEKYKGILTRDIEITEIELTKMIEHMFKKMSFGLKKFKHTEYKRDDVNTSKLFLSRTKERIYVLGNSTFISTLKSNNRDFINCYYISNNGSLTIDKTRVSFPIFLDEQITVQVERINNVITDTDIIARWIKSRLVMLSSLAQKLFGNVYRNNPKYVLYLYDILDIRPRKLNYDTYIKITSNLERDTLEYKMLNIGELYIQELLIDTNVFKHFMWYIMNQYIQNRENIDRGVYLVKGSEIDELYIDDIVDLVYTKSLLLRKEHGISIVWQNLFGSDMELYTADDVTKTLKSDIKINPSVRNMLSSLSLFIKRRRTTTILGNVTNLNKDGVAYNVIIRIRDSVLSVDVRERFRSLTGEYLKDEYIPKNILSSKMLQTVMDISTVSYTKDFIAHEKVERQEDPKHNNIILSNIPSDCTNLGVKYLTDIQLTSDKPLVCFKNEWSEKELEILEKNEIKILKEGYYRDMRNLPKPKYSVRTMSSDTRGIDTHVSYVVKKPDVPLVIETNLDIWNDQNIAEIESRVNNGKNRMNRYNSQQNQIASQVVYPFRTPHGGMSLNGILKSKYGAQRPSRAYAKCLELLTQSLRADEIISKSSSTQSILSQSQITTFHNAEYPGSFIMATNQFMHNQGKEWDWVGSSMVSDKVADSENPEMYDEMGRRKTSSTLLEIYPELKKYESAGNWIMYDSSGSKPKLHKSRGDTTDVEYLEYTRSKLAISKIVVDIYTADGGMDVSDDYNRQEEINAKLNLGQCLMGLMTLRQGGIFISKTYSLYLGFSVSWTYFLSTLFEKFYIFKPQTSGTTNSEVYYLGVGYKGCSETVLRKIQNHLSGNFNPRVPVFDMTDFDVDSMIRVNDQLARRQISELELHYFALQGRRMHRPKEKYIRDWLFTYVTKAKWKRLNNETRI